MTLRLTMQARHYCPACGYSGLKGPPYSNFGNRTIVRGLAPPYSEHFGMPSYEVCPCCGFEFGNDDDPGGGAVSTSFEQYLDEWIREGCIWLDPSVKPPGWTLEAQLREATQIDQSG
jgi:hypothetical protein